MTLLHDKIKERNMMIMLTKRILVTVFNDIYQTKGKRIETTVSDFAAGLKAPERLSVTASQYDAMCDEEKRKLKFGGEVYALSTYRDDIQTGARDAQAYGITLDADEADTQLPEVMKKHFPDVYMLIHTTFGSRENKPRYRILIFLDRTVTKEEYGELCRRVAEKVPEYKFDEAGFRINQKMLIPRVLSDVEYHYYEWGRELLNVDELLVNTKKRDGQKAQTETGASYRDPTTGENVAVYGPINAFNDAHPITEIMESLSDVYEPTGTKNRYKLIGSDSAPGVIIDTEKNVAISFHANDPSQGKPVNSFDLYRIHRYGNLDKDCPAGTKKSRLKSFEAMMEAVKKDKKVQDLLEAHRGEHKLKKDPTGGNIMRMLHKTHKGEPKNCSANAVIIVQNDPKLSGIMYDEFIGQFVVTSPLPWERSGLKYPHKFGEFDRKAMIAYISSTYETEMGTTIDNALADLTFTRSIHPLRDYLLGLEWDGTPRVEGMLTRYLGVEDSEYTRAAIRVTMVSAVKRVFEPGCKADTVLVLLGKQGTGKSTLIRKLSKGYFSDNIRCQDMANKNAPEKLRGVFIAELSEMAGYSKADIEMVKSFITCQSDNYREPYARIVSEHPRSNIFIGTSNRITGLLTDETGNRRFLPVYTTDAREVAPWDMTDEDVDRLWAEATAMYRNGAATVMPLELTEETVRMQDGAVIEDDRAQLVQQYLDVLLPEDWYSMSIEDRRDYINHEGKYVGEPYDGTMQRQYVCAAEIGLELFKLKKVDLTLRLSKEIALMLRKLGWTEYPNSKGRRTIPGYNKPTAFCRPQPAA